MSLIWPVAAAWMAASACRFYNANPVFRGPLREATVPELFNLGAWLAGGPGLRTVRLDGPSYGPPISRSGIVLLFGNQRGGAAPYAGDLGG